MAGTPPAGPKPPPIPHVEVTKEIIAAAPTPPRAPTSRNNRTLLIGASAAAVVVIVGGLYFFWPSHPKPPPPKPAAKPAVQKPAAPTASTTLPPAKPAPAPAAPKAPASEPTSIAHVPAQSINRAASVAARQSEGAQATNEVMASSSSQPAAKPVPSPASAQSQPVATAETQLAPGVSATTAVDSAAAASPAFRTFVANLRIAGIANGSSPRALINGRLVHVGDTLDSSLGVVFAGVKDDQLVFKDASGATVSRRY